MNNFIKSILFPFNHNPENFKIKVVHERDNVRYDPNKVNFKYSANGGKSWKRVHSFHYAPWPGQLAYWHEYSCDIGDGSLEKEFEMFSSYQKILDFEKVEYAKYLQYFTDINLTRIKENQQRKEAFDKANNIKK